MQLPRTVLRMKRLVLLPLIAFGCTDEGTVVECGDGTMLNIDGTMCIPDRDAPRLACGPGTKQIGLECVVDDQRRFELRVKSRDISANQLQPISVLALGTNADGSLVNEEALLTIDRPGAGLFTRSRFTLGEMGALTHFRPCSGTQAGCTGPVRFALALASDPNTPVATLDVNLMNIPEGSSASACETPNNVMFFDGEDDIFAGTLSVLDAAWGVAIQGAGRRCPGNLRGRFQVHSYTVTDDVVTSALISFEQRCAGAARDLRGCIRIGN
jgi:hypothetical protein